MTLLHFFEKHLATKAAVEGTDVTALCGVVVDPETEDGHIVFNPGNKDLCGRCLGKISGPRSTHKRRRAWAKQTLAAATAGDSKEA